MPHKLISRMSWYGSMGQFHTFEGEIMFDYIFEVKQSFRCTIRADSAEEAQKFIEARVEAKNAEGMEFKGIGWNLIYIKGVEDD